METPVTKRVYVVEDHPLMRRMVSDFIASTPGLEVAGAATTGEEALEHLGAAQADLALVDMSLPHMSGADLVAQIRARWPGLRCLMLSGHREGTYVQRALAAGARGYVLKGGDPLELAEAIRRVLAGGVYLSEPVRELE